MRQMRMCLALSFSVAAAAADLPHLECRGEATQLVVDGKPFLVLAGELYNNPATSLEYMKPVWPDSSLSPLS